MKLMPLLVLALLWAGAGLAQLRVPETPQFRRIGTEDGLPSSRINALAQDATGYLWIATDDGVARYDGVSMRVWRHDPGIVGGMPANLVNALHVDRHDEVWVAFSDAGVARIDGRRSEVTPLVDAALPGFERADVWSMAETPDGALWFAAFGTGLYQRDAQGRFRAWGPVPTGAAAQPQERLIALATTVDGTLWIGTVAGLAQVVDGRVDAVAAGELDEASVVALNAEPDGSLWITTRNHGLWQRTPAGRFERSPWSDTLGSLRVHGVQRDGRGGRWVHTARGLFHDSGDGLRRPPSPEAAEGNYQQMLVDRQGGLWFGDAEYGLVWLSGYWRSFATLSRDNPLFPLSMRQATAFLEGPDGEVLIAGDEGRIDRLDRRGLRLETTVFDPARFKQGRILSMAHDAQGGLWVGASNLLAHRDARGTWRQWAGGGIDAPPAGALDFIVPMPDGRLWVAVYGGGLQQRAADGRVLVQVGPESGHGLETFHSEVVTRGPDDALWVANAQGVLRWNGERFETLVGPEGGTVQGLAFVDENEFWVYRPGRLQRWQRDEDGLWSLVDSADSANDGLPSAEAGGLVRDAAGRLWIFSVRGLVRFDPATRNARLFGSGDGLREREFGLRPPRVLAGGVVIAGSVGGAVLFDPMQVEPDTRVASLVIESVSVRRAEDLVALDPAKPLVLRPEDRDLRIVARLMSFADPGAHRYRFRLMDYDPDWVDVGAQGERLLPRQSPGTYQLDVAAAGADGRWSEPLRLEFDVEPPWWQTWWARTGFVLGLLALLAGAAGLYVRRVHQRAETRQAQDARRLAQQASEAKTAFLADLGHELRTPLTGVLGMTELMLKAPLPDEQRQRAETVFRAGQHLLRLVNDTLDLARIEAGRLLLHDEPFDLASLVSDVAQWLRPLAEAKGLAFMVSLAPGLPPRVRGDEARVRQILLNLGGNAIKFTERGQVALSVRASAQSGLQFEVEDTGIGLDTDEQRRLFQRFEQAEGEHTQRRYGGTGLGLAISRELARAMGGDLQLRSTKGQGTCFTVTLALPEETVTGATPSTPASGASVGHGPMDVLLVEDDPVVAEVMIGLLSSLGHRVHHAPQALAAMTLLKTQRIDFGLVDLDLPAVDGFELARLIRQTGWRLPLVAVTARADMLSERRARAAGMDGYLRKPVSGAMLAEVLAGVSVEAP